MITIIKCLVLFCLALLLNLAIPRPGWLGAVFPPFCVLLILFVSLRWGEITGAVVGFLMGIIYAALFLEPLGLSSLIFMLIGYSSGKIAPFLRDTPRLVLFIFALFMILGYDLVAGMGTILLSGGVYHLNFGSALVGGLIFAACLPPLMTFFREF